MEDGCFHLFGSGLSGLGINIKEKTCCLTGFGDKQFSLAYELGDRFLDDVLANLAE
jgi:hypothetical protein